jgi:molybdate/tungstate transport system substrate-binding protein
VVSIAHLAPGVRWRPALVVGLLVAGLTAGCSPTSTATRAIGNGPVDVLYAASLTTVVNEQLGPAFHVATGYSLSGEPGGSDALASQIEGRTTVVDVFVSASTNADLGLEGRAGHDRVSWYATFATSELVLGYSRASRFASQLRTRPWYDVLGEPGFLLGRTDPATDPKGKLAVSALEQTSAIESLAPLAKLAATSSGVFPEETLVGRLQSGQLDAGFFYASEAAAAGLASVPLTPVHLEARYTVTVVNGAPHQRAATAFVSFLLGRHGRAILTRDDFSVVWPPRVDGRRQVPSSLRAALGMP